MALPSGAFQGGSLALFPIGTAVAIVGWQKPLLGGTLALGLGIPVMLAIVTATGWGLLYEVAYFSFCAAFLCGGMLHLVKGIARRLDR